MICYNVIRKIGDFMKLTHFLDDKIDYEYTNITNEEEKNSKKYKFFLDNILNYIYITDRLIFIRENDEYVFHLEISNKPLCSITLKKENKSFDINVIEAKYTEVKKNIVIEYKIESDNFKHKIVLEIGD